MTISIINRKNSNKNRIRNLGRNKTHATLKERRSQEKKKLEDNINFIEKNTDKTLKTPVPKKIMSLLKRVVSKGNTKSLIHKKVETAKNMYNQNEKKKKQLLKKFRSGIELNRNELFLLINLHKYDNELPYDLKVFIDQQKKKTPSKSKVIGPYELKYLTQFNKLYPNATYEERQDYINELRKLFKHNTYKLNKKNPLVNKRKQAWL